jgi:arginine utilization protein RocB
LRIGFDYSCARELDLPVINVGPWGRDYHQRLERVYMPYSFGVLPELVWRITGDLLDENSQ